MHAELAKVDPTTAARLALATASAFSAHWRCGMCQASRCRVFTLQKRSIQRKRSKRYSPFSLEPNNRAWLHERIAQRFDAMLAAGFMDEVRAPCARRPACRPAIDALRVTARRGRTDHQARKGPMRR